MTLIELLIVMALMAGLATFALTSMDELSVRSRYDVTVKRMDIIRRLIMGDGITAGRFVADMGRLPLNLRELWKNPEENASYGKTNWFLLANDDSYATVTGSIYCGWNGPYLMRDTNETTLCDGFGSNFTYNGSCLTAGLKDNERVKLKWKEDLTYDFSSALKGSLTVEVKVKLIDGDSQVPWGNVMSSWGTKYPAMASGNEKDRVYSYSSNLYTCVDNSNNNDSDPFTAPGNWQVVPRHEYMTKAEVILAIPPGSSPLRMDIADGKPCMFSNLAPGVRQVAAYGYTRDSAMTTNGWWSGLQTIEIHPGANFVTLYLTEPLKAKAP